jgi:hypothetical protein
MAAMPARSARPDWLLVMDDPACGGVLARVWLQNIDQPWYYCAFDPTPDFEVVRPRLEAISQALDSGDLARADAIIEGLAAMGLRLVPADGDDMETRADLEGSLQLSGSEISFRPA